MTAITAVRPSSSPIAATMKSDSANGTRSGLPPPKPLPMSPPHAMPKRPSTSWPLPGDWS